MEDAPFDRNKQNSGKFKHTLDFVNRDNQEEQRQLKQQNAKLKKSIRELQAKRNHITKQCAETERKLQIAEGEVAKLKELLRYEQSRDQSQKFKTQELKFLNRNLASEIDSLRYENEELNEKLNYSTEILERKYEELEVRTLKKIEQAIKRLKKEVHYLEALSPLEIEKTRGILVENLKKSIDLLRGKGSESDYDREITELLNPIKSIQEELSESKKQLQRLQTANKQLEEELHKHKKIEKELFPEYKDAIEKLKKNLGAVRSQLSENEYQKKQLKSKYESKIKQMENKHGELFLEFRKLKLEKKIYQNRMEEMQADNLEEKERLTGENQILKRLYRHEGKHAAPKQELRDRNRPKEQRAKAIVADSYKRSAEYKKQIEPKQLEQSEDYQEYLEELHNKNMLHSFKNQKGIRVRESDRSNIEERKPYEYDRYGGSQLGASKTHLGQKYYQRDDADFKQEKSNGHRPFLKKNYSSSNLREARQHREKQEPNRQRSQIRHDKDLRMYQRDNQQESEHEQETSNYDRGNHTDSYTSQESLKNEICKIDQEIMEIQRNLTRELEAYQ